MAAQEVIITELYCEMIDTRQSRIGTIGGYKNRKTPEGPLNFESIDQYNQKRQIFHID